MHIIYAFEDLERLFRVAFSFRTRRKKGVMTLLVVWQGDGKILRDYMNRFATTVQDLEEAEEPVVMMALLNGLRGTFSTRSTRSPKPCIEPRES